MINKAVKEMIKEHKEGIITLENDTYFYDGYNARPIECSCNGEIHQYNYGSYSFRFNYDTKGFDILTDDEPADQEYRCVDCDKQLDVLQFDEKTKVWV